MKRRLIALAAVSLMLVACGETDGADPTTTVPDPTTTIPTDDDTTTTTAADGSTTTTADDGTTTTTTPPQTADHTIRITGFSFVGPASIGVGETVEVVNEDAVPHTWTSADNLWSSGTLTGTDTFLHTFEDEGTFSFVCSIHPEMTGSITVGG